MPFGKCSGIRTQKAPDDLPGWIQEFAGLRFVAGLPFLRQQRLAPEQRRGAGAVGDLAANEAYWVVALSAHVCYTGDSMSGGVTRFSVSVDPDLLEEFDEVIRDFGYNRSTAIQVAMRGFLTEHKWSTVMQETVAGAVTMIYDHHTRGLVDQLTDIQHDYSDVISSTTHVHLDHDNCLEILAIKGEVQRLEALTKSLRVVRGVKQLKFSILGIK